MEPEVGQTLRKIFDLLSKNKELTSEERSYIIGTLETLLTVYTKGDMPEKKGFLGGILG